ncbi:hypothetical protein PanWU01x14_230380, partial [Parasponia andersonii]
EKWKADNGTFKPGYLQELEKIMSVKIQSCRIKAQPHIDSHIKLWKKQYHTIFEMLGPLAIGFGWNEKLKYVVADQYVFDEWVKSHPAAKGLKNKAFPHYDELGIVFGKDRATGHGAMGFSKMVEEIDKKIENEQESEHGPFTLLDELVGNFEADGAARRMKVFDELKTIDGLTNDQ